jgi:PHD/YefM family antitoxin component YafN of YafNO toxin-antitoxin module
MRIPTATMTDANLTMMIADLCAQHPKLTGTNKARNAAYLKELVTEKARRAA